jgi:hypothetical protein
VATEIITLPGHLRALFDKVYGHRERLGPWSAIVADTGAPAVREIGRDGVGLGSACDLAIGRETYGTAGLINKLTFV